MGSRRISSSSPRVAERQRRVPRARHIGRAPSATQSSCESNTPVKLGGDRAGRGSGHSLGRPSWERILRATAESSIVRRNSSAHGVSRGAGAGLQPSALTRVLAAVYGLPMTEVQGSIRAGLLASPRYLNRKGRSRSVAHLAGAAGSCDGRRCRRLRFSARPLPGEARRTLARANPEGAASALESAKLKSILGGSSLPHARRRRV